MSIDTYFIITPPAGQNAKQWAGRMWDTYGFDYDMQRTWDTVFAWPCEGTVEDLSSNLRRENIVFETMELDTDEVFAVDD